MKYIFITLLAVTLLFSCSNDKKELKDDPNTEIVENFLINGKIEGAANTKVYLEAMGPQGVIPVADCETNSDGEFDMLGNIPDMGIYQLRLGESKEKIITLTLVPQDNVVLTTSYDGFQMKPKFEGTEWSKTLTEYVTMFNQFAIDQEVLSKKQNQLSEDELMTEYFALLKPLETYCYKAIMDDPDNPVNFLLASSLMPNMGFKYWNNEYMKPLKEMAKAYSIRFKDSPIAINMEQQLNVIDSKYKQFIAINTGEAVAPEIILNNPQGKEIKLSSLRGKYVLIDFWASWCGPCRKENPNLVRLYKQYKDKGFTIYSVSLDNNHEAWQKAIESDELIWQNHVSDLKGWDTPLTTLYGFQSIPHTVLIDKEGKIIGMGLRAQSLEQKLKEVLN